MLRRSVTNGCVLVLAGMLALAGCRENDPETRFNYNLGAEGTRLLPGDQVAHGAHDARLASGKTTADLHKMGDEPVPDEPVALEGVVMDMPPADGVSDALGNVGRAFLGNLMTGGASGSGAAAPGPAHADAAPSGGAPSGAALAQDDAQAIAALVADYSDAMQDKDFRRLAGLCVSTQAVTAQELFDYKDELNASLESLLVEYDKTSPGAKARVEQQVAAVLGAWTVEGLTANGADAASGVLTSGGRTQAVFFAREDGAWRIEYADVPEAAEWDAEEASWETAIEQLDDLTASAAGGAVDDAAAQAAIQQAIELLFGAGA